MKKIIVNQNEVLELLGISKVTLKNWIKYDGFPKPLNVSNYYGEKYLNKEFSSHRKRYYLREIEKWLDRKQRESNMSF